MQSLAKKVIPFPAPSSGLTLGGLIAVIQELTSDDQLASAVRDDMLKQGMVRQRRGPKVN
jgi:hypothetical protein